MTTHPQYIHYVIAFLIVFVGLSFTDRVNGSPIRPVTTAYIFALVTAASVFLRMGSP